MTQHKRKGRRGLRGAASAHAAAARKHWQHASLNSANDDCVSSLDALTDLAKVEVEADWAGDLALRAKARNHTPAIMADVLRLCGCKKR